MKKLTVMIERASDGSFSAYLKDPLSLPYGLNGVGDNKREAIEDWLSCYEGMKESFAKRGEPFKEAEFQFIIDVPSFLIYYGGMLTYKGLARVTGVSAAQLSQYATGYRQPSVRTAKKIENGLHRFADELSQLQLV